MPSDPSTPQSDHDLDHLPTNHRSEDDVEKLFHVTWQLNGGVRRINGKNYSTALLTGELRSGFGDDVIRTSMWWSGEVPGGCVRTTSTEIGTSMLDRDKEFVKKEVKRFGAFRIFEMPTLLDVSLASFT